MTVGFRLCILSVLFLLILFAPIAETHHKTQRSSKSGWTSPVSLTARWFTCYQGQIDRGTVSVPREAQARLVGQTPVCVWHSLCQTDSALFTVISAKINKCLMHVPFVSYWRIVFLRFIRFLTCLPSVTVCDVKYVIKWAKSVRKSVIKQVFPSVRIISTLQHHEWRILRKESVTEGHFD